MGGNTPKASAVKNRTAEGWTPVPSGTAPAMYSSG